MTTGFIPIRCCRHLDTGKFQQCLASVFVQCANKTFEPIKVGMHERVLGKPIQGLDFAPIANE